MTITHGKPVNGRPLNVRLKMIGIISFGRPIMIIILLLLVRVLFSLVCVMLSVSIVRKMVIFLVLCLISAIAAGKSAKLHTIL